MGMINFYDGRFTKGGAAMHLKPPHVLVAKGGIQELTHLCGMDVVYSFDKVNGSDTHKAVGKDIGSSFEQKREEFCVKLESGRDEKGWISQRDEKECEKEWISQMDIGAPVHRQFCW
jgi:hypothetical protein